jgi:FG-GAP-like repeat
MKPEVVVYDAQSGAEKFRFLAYNENFRGGVRVAGWDVTGDNTPDVVTGTGAGGGSEVRVFDGKTGNSVSGPLGSFRAFAPSYRGAVNVAAGYVNADNFGDIVVSTDVGGTAQVKVFSGADGSQLYNFAPYGEQFHGGVRVAVGDVTGDGRADIVTAPISGSEHEVRVFDAATGALACSFAPYGNTTPGGIFVAAGDLTGDGRADIVTGPGSGAPPVVKIYDGVTHELVQSFAAYDDSFRGGVRLALADATGDYRLDILTGMGPGGQELRTFDGKTLERLDRFRGMVRAGRVASSSAAMIPS